MKHVEKPLCIISPCNLHLVERNTQTTWVHNKLLLYWSILHGKNNPAATCCLWFTIRWAQSPGLNGVKTIYGFVKWVTEAITPICYKWSEKSNPTYIGHPGCSFAHPQYAQYARLEFPHLFWSNYNISPTQISWKKEISLTIHHHLRWELVFGRYNFDQIYSTGHGRLFHHHLSCHGLPIWTPEVWFRIVTWRWWTSLWAVGGSSQLGCKWLVTPPFISHEFRPFGRETTQSLGGLTITMVINHLQVLGWSSK